jgi:signal peptide peptidase SppA
MTTAATSNSPADPTQTATPEAVAALLAGGEAVPLSLADLRDHRVPYLEEYFGVWCMAPDQFLAAYAIVRQTNVLQHVSQVKAAGGVPSGRSYDYAVGENGIATVDLAGTLMKQTSSMSGGTSTVMARGTIRKMMNDKSVDGVMLRVDSPGGTAAGTMDLADDVYQLAQRKPVCVYADGLMASAAMWVGSQGTEISAGADALVGSVGTYAVVYDVSKWAADQGIKAHVIRAGDFKGMGTPGTEVTDQQLGEYQRIVDAINQNFLNGLARGRRMTAEQVKGVNDGRIHPAADAKKLGLVDHVENYDAAYARLEQRVAAVRAKSSGGTNTRVKAESDDLAAQSAVEGNPSDNKETPMTGQNQAAGSSAAQTTAGAGAGGNTAATEPRPATLGELKAAFGTNMEFAFAAAEQGWTMAEAQAAWQVVQSVTPKAGVGGATQSTTTGKPAGSGNRPLATAPRRTATPPASAAADGTDVEAAGFDGDPVAEFSARVEAKMKQPGVTRRQAVLKVAGADPELHQAFLMATNSRKVHSKIQDKFGGDEE